LPKVRVAVAMSGGVDSSVACLLLAQKGFEVVGLTMKLLANPPSHDRTAKACCSLEITENAKKVCFRLGIPHYTIDLVEEFEENVIFPFIRDYVHGKTPNPCLLCNSKIKFGRLLRKAREIGAEYLATGHYVRAGRFDSSKKFWENHEIALPKLDNFTSRVFLLRGKYRPKDQSYALYGLTQEMLAHAMFPLGSLTKEKVRKIAKEKGLVTAEKTESQEICFVTEGSYRTFLAERGVKVEPGPILDTSGKILGKHRGIAFYTIGQRKGLGIGGGEPLYVVNIDVGKNQIIVGKREEAYSKGAYLEEVNLIAQPELESVVKGTCMVRYRGKEVSATLMPEKEGKDGQDRSRALVMFDEPQFAVTPGQALVFYQGDMVYGGGVISRRIWN